MDAGELMGLDRRTRRKLSIYGALNDSCGEKNNGKRDKFVTQAIKNSLQRRERDF